MAKRLTVAAPAEQVQDLRLAARAHRMSIYKDGAYLKLKRGDYKPILEAAAKMLPEGSFEIYHAHYYYSGPSHTPQLPNAVRIKVK